MKDKKEIINNLKTEIKRLLRDLGEYHQKTFYMQDDERYKDKKNLTGEDIYTYSWDMEMDKREDACYLIGKIEAYQDMLKTITGNGSK